MSTLDLTSHFSRFRAAAPQRITLACHSHHDWPDVTQAAQQQAWLDAARLTGDKWDVVFDQIVPKVQAALARHLHLPDPTTITFAPNTHELLRRLLSCFPADRPIRILTSDSEFHTARRQFERLEEDGLVVLSWIAAEPFATFADRFASASAAGGHDMVFVSQVFFNSGATCGDLAQLAAAIPSRDTFLVIDGYHGFMARPTDLSAVAERAFYLAGGYKYAMSGEGCCFLHCPPGYGPRPRDTGWYADFGSLAAPAGKKIGYPANADRFLGATFDPSGLYRMASVFDWLAAQGITAEQVHDHAVALMTQFLTAIEPLAIDGMSRRDLITPFGAGDAHGNFLTFRTSRAGEIEERLAKVDVDCDHRGDRLRFGFGICLNAADVARAATRLKEALAGT
jgi:selenocysteine lyase/cysteine desulfurase